MIKAEAIVTVEWLNLNLSDNNIIVLDASLRKDKTGQPIPYLNVGIPNTRYFNITEVFSDLLSPYPNMLPAYNILEQEIRKLGINKSSKIIIYDNKGIYSSARAWWMFKLLGHENVSVLNGGFPAWKSKGFQIEPIRLDNMPLGDFKIQPQEDLVVSYSQVKANVETKDFTVIDARSKARFYGLTPEPRKLTKSGHIPDSKNLHYQELLNDGFLKTETEIIERFNALNLDNKPIIFSCGSGITACILYLAAYIYLDKAICVYDGSWTEWGERKC